MRERNAPVLALILRVVGHPIPRFPSHGLEQDVSETDRYGLLVRDVWRVHPDGQRMLNEALVEQGYAQVSTYPPDVEYTAQFQAAQQAAQAGGRRLWGVCGEFGVPLAQEPTPTTPAQSGGECAPAYPGVCIPPISVAGDLNGGDISERWFTVLPPDPHGFDQEGDGIGCEGSSSDRHGREEREARPASRMQRQLCSSRVAERTTTTGAM